MNTSRPRLSAHNPYRRLGAENKPSSVSGYLVCYRLAIPLFAEGSICQAATISKWIKGGDCAVHCASKIGVKFRHNLVRDMLVDICCKAGILVRKEAPLGFYLEPGKDLRPADFLLFNWLGYMVKTHVWMSLEARLLLAQESPHGHLVLL